MGEDNWSTLRARHHLAVQRDRHSARIVANAQNEVDTVRQRAIDEASARIGEIVFELVAKVVGREVDQSAHQDLVREAIAALDAEAQRETNH